MVDHPLAVLKALGVDVWLPIPKPRAGFVEVGMPDAVLRPKPWLILLPAAPATPELQTLLNDIVRSLPVAPTEVAVLSFSAQSVAAIEWAALYAAVSPSHIVTLGALPPAAMVQKPLDSEVLFVETLALETLYQQPFRKRQVFNDVSTLSI